MDYLKEILQAMLKENYIVTIYELEDINAELSDPEQAVKVFKGDNLALCLENVKACKHGAVDFSLLKNGKVIDQQSMVFVVDAKPSYDVIRKRTAKIQDEWLRLYKEENNEPSVNVIPPHQIVPKYVIAENDLKIIQLDLMQKIMDEVIEHNLMFENVCGLTKEQCVFMNLTTWVGLIKACFEISNMTDNQKATAIKDMVEILENV